MVVLSWKLTGTNPYVVCRQPGNQFDIWKTTRSRPLIYLSVCRSLRKFMKFQFNLLFTIVTKDMHEIKTIHWHFLLYCL